MKFINIILIAAIIPLTCATIQWDYFLFVQLWPGSWLHGDYCALYHFNNTYFTIHGLWPEYKNGSWPQYCNITKFNVTELDSIRSDLELYWTDFNNAEKFWAHEYYKHMSCLEEDNIFSDEYICFSTGLNWRNKMDLYSVLNASNITPSNNKYYSVEQIRDVISKYYNYDIVVVCDHNDILTEIRFCFDPNLNMFNCPPSEMDKGCNQKMVWYNEII